MKKLMLLILLFTLVVAPLSAKPKKGHLSVKAKVSLYDPPDGGSTTIYGVNATYRLSSFFSVAGNVEYSVYDNDSNEDVTYLPVTVEGKFHPLGLSSNFDPYLGAGLGLFLKTVGDDNESTFGYEMLGGITYHSNTGIGFTGEAKYSIPDVSKPDVGGLTIGGGVEGSFEMDL